MTEAVLHDATKCIGCRACEVACKQWNKLPATTINLPFYETQLSAYIWTRIRPAELENDGKFPRVFTKLQCMHCEHPACVAACPIGALKKSPDGPVTYDDSICFGCRYCLVACPFGIPTFEWDKPIPWVRKCTFCVDRLSVDLEPACVSICPTAALKFGQREELLAEAKRRIIAAPSKYVNHIYGEKEVGGTSWLYLSPVPFEKLYLSPVLFEKLGLPNFGSEPVTVNVERAMGTIPAVLVAVGAVMTGIYWLFQRRQKMEQKEAEKQKGAAKQ